MGFEGSGGEKESGRDFVIFDKFIKYDEIVR